MLAAPPATAPAFRRFGALLAAIALAVVALNAVLFWTPLYRRVVAPDSSAGTLLATLRPLQQRHFERARDVLVVGDSRMFRAFDPTAADAAEPRLRFFNAAVPGTTPRCWPYLARSADPAANDLAAVVIPVDSYADLDSSLGALDADAHLFDLRFLAVSSGLRDVPTLAASFPGPDRKLGAALSLALRGPIFADDFQALIADPAARSTALAAAANAPDPTARGHADAKTLRGLSVDPARTKVAGVPVFLDSVESAEISAAELVRPLPSPSWGAYRERWLGMLAERYRAAGVPVVFVRVPPRPIPLPDEADDSPSPQTSIGRILARGGAVALPAAPYVRFERPELFSDHDHLSAPGARAFSARLARDVAGAIVRLHAKTAARAAPRAFATADVDERSSDPRPLAIESFFGRIFGFGAPLRLGSLDDAIFVLCVLALWNAPGPAFARRSALLAASWYFYARWNALYLVFLIALTLSDYVIALAIERARERPAQARLRLGIGVAANLAFLGTLKYSNFLGASLGALAGGEPLWALHLIVPIGISFHTFQSISYLVDVRRGTIPARRNLLDYALYLAFFPQLLAGPIVRAGVFLRELDVGAAPNLDAVARGLAEIVRGLFKKFALADQVAPYANAYFEHVADHTNAHSAWSGAVAFALQIYFDFSGYSDIAIGTARLFGFAFPENFRRPYFATGASDFWRRWHISLSTWLRDYLYIPLGGNRHGTSATIRNLMLTMLLGGLWHGAGWTFVAWGAYHGAWLSIERLWRTARPHAALAPRRPTPFAHAASVGAAALVALLGWVLFRANSFGDAWTTWRAMAGAFPDVDWNPVLVPPWMLAVAGLAFGAEALAETGFRLPSLARFRPRDGLLTVTAATLTLVGLELLWAPTEQTFVYFKF